MVMEEITWVGKEWKEMFEVENNIRKGGDGVILQASADDSPTYTSCFSRQS
jgi:hypothetical protein